MSKDIEEIFKEWLKEKPMAKILVTKNSQMGYIIEFAEYYSEQKLITTKLKERVKELCNNPNCDDGIVDKDYYGKPIFCHTCEQAD